MTEGNEVDRFIKNPRLLVELCRDVVDRLDASAEESSVEVLEAQLRAIAKAVEQLESSGVTVPAVLRGEKTRLAASLALYADAKQALTQLADEFQDILKDLRERLGQSAGLRETRPRRQRSKLPKTPNHVLREHILLALKKLGGKALVPDVIAEMTRQLEGALLPGDIVWRETTNEPAWQNNAKWERFQMTQDGTLSRDSPRGIWQLAEEDL